MKITDQEMYAAFLELKTAAERDEALLVERDRLEVRLEELKIHFEDGGEEAKARDRLRKMMIDRNMKVLLVGDDVVTLIPNRLVLSTGLTELNLEPVS